MYYQRKPIFSRLNRRFKADDHWFLPRSTCVFHAGFGVGYFMSESYYRNFTQKRFRKPNLVTHTHYTQFSPPPSSRHYHTVPGVPSIMGSPSPFIVHTTRDGSSRKVGRHFDSFNLSNFFLANFRHGCGGQKAKRVLI